MAKNFCEQVVDAVRYGVESYGSQSALCRASGVSNANLSRWLDGLPPKVNQVGPMFDVLGVKLDIPDSEKAHYVYVDKVAAKAGAGSSLVTSAESVGTYAFRKDFMAREGIRAKSCIMLDVVGDSMEPLLKEGDTIMVDQSQREILDGKTYLVAYGEELRVKHLFKSPQGVILHSENPRYPDVTICPEEIGTYFIVHGRVRWFGRIL